MSTQNDKIPSTEMAVTEDALMGGRVRLLQPKHGYRVAVDAVLLAAAVDARPGEKVLDLGAGVGSVGLCLAARVPDCRITGIELQDALVALAERNAALNRLSDRVRTLRHDLAQPLPGDLGLFEHVAANPPYLPAAVADPSPDPIKALATVESSANLERWLDIATSAATSTVTLVHRSDRLEEIVAGLGRRGWTDLAILPLTPVPRVLVRARRSPGGQRRESPPFVLHRPEGGYTVAAEAVLRHAAPLAF
jgi:tRNA1(Val) A37 N6-methylase TrmN6